MDMQIQTPRRSRHPVAVRVIALVLAVLLLLEVGLFNASTVRFLRERYVESDYEDLADYLVQDDEYMSMTRLERMRAILANMLAPETYDDYEMAASIAVANEDYAKASEYLAGCIRLFEGDEKGLAELHVKLGCVYGLRDHWTMASSSFERAAEIDAENANAWLLLSESQLRLGDYEQALEAVLTYQSLAPLNASQYVAVAGMQLQLGRNEDAVESCTAALALDDCNRAETCYTRAQARYLLGDAAAAAADAEEALAAGESSMECRVLLAMCYDELGDYAASLPIYQGLLADGMTDESMYEQAVQTAYLLEDYETMISLAQEALRQPGDAAERVELYKWLGAAYIELQDYPAAEENLSIYFERAEGGGELYYLRGLARLAQENYPGAEADFTVTLEKAEGLIDESLYNRGLCRLWLEDAEGAAADFQLILDRGANPEIVEMVKQLLELEE